MFSLCIAILRPLNSGSGSSLRAGSVAAVRWAPTELQPTSHVTLVGAALLLQGRNTSDLICHHAVLFVLLCPS